MKKLGIIGGAGPLASALFYQTLVQESYQMKRELPEIILLNYPFKREVLQEKRLVEELTTCCKELERNNVFKAVLVCNTLHMELKKIKHGMLFFHINECVIDEIVEKKGKRVLLLATKATCNSTLYYKEGVQFLVPADEEQSVIESVIDNVLKGDLKKSDSEVIESLIKRYRDEIDGVVLGCTDLPVVHHHFPIRTNKRVYDSVKIPAEAIVRLL
ncbi:MAG: hypothetical protein FJZ59_00675 [Chlamydiae bacterium]|jgi:aspartate racemase|nr:hypothetical protein [Chlamydiota bacterium]